MRPWGSFEGRLTVDGAFFNVNPIDAALYFFLIQFLPLYSCVISSALHFGKPEPPAAWNL
jgi:hypothetical protein